MYTHRPAHLCISIAISITPQPLPRPSPQLLPRPSSSPSPVAHTDSPCPKLKPISILEKDKNVMLSVVGYGGRLWHTWFDLGSEYQNFAKTLILTIFIVSLEIAKISN